MRFPWTSLGAKHTGSDGKDGQNGTSGTDGKDGLVITSVVVVSVALASNIALAAWLVVSVRNFI